MSDIDSLLTRARAALQRPEPESQSFFQVLPKDVPVPIPRTNYGGGDSRTADKFVVRMPDDMRHRMARYARLHLRSMNSECLVAMEWWMDRQTLMWSMLQATERELTRLEQLHQREAREEAEILDAIAQRNPKLGAFIAELKARLRQG